MSWFVFSWTEIFAQLSFILNCQHCFPILHCSVSFSNKLLNTISLPRSLQHGDYVKNAWCFRIIDVFLLMFWYKDVFSVLNVAFCRRHRINLVLTIFSVIPQLFGNGDGFGDFLEHNLTDCRWILYLCQKCTKTTKIHFHHYFWRHGMYNRNLRPQSFIVLQ
jgi:hypothetical protein